MKRSPGTGPRALALCLAGALTASLALPAAAAEPIGDNVTPTYDEAYYATLDYYGNLTEGSVVKSYTLNGATALTDCGTYDQVVNLTDGTLPVTRNGVTEFRFDQAPPTSTSRAGRRSPSKICPGPSPSPIRSTAWQSGQRTWQAGPAWWRSPWTPSPMKTPATTPGTTTPWKPWPCSTRTIFCPWKPRGSGTAHRQPEGGAVHRSAGEEQHFVIRVGSEDFSFSGITFLMVPATLSQLQEIAKLSQRKDELEEDYDALSGSLDTLLDSFTDLGSSLRDTASGLDELNRARNTISSGKDQIYQDGDRVLADLRRLNGSLNTLPGHLTGTGDAVDDVTGALSGVADAAVGLQGSLDDVNNSLRDLQRDIRDIRSGTGSMEDHLDQLGADLKSLQDSLQELEELLKALDIQISGGIISEIPENVRQHIKVQGQKLGYPDPGPGPGDRVGQRGEGRRGKPRGDNYIPPVPNCRPAGLQERSQRCGGPGAAEPGAGCGQRHCPDTGTDARTDGGAGSSTPGNRRQSDPGSSGDICLCKAKIGPDETGLRRRHRRRRPPHG